MWVEKHLIRLQILNLKAQTLFFLGQLLVSKPDTSAVIIRTLRLYNIWILLRCWFHRIRIGIFVWYHGMVSPWYASYVVHSYSPTLDPLLYALFIFITKRCAHELNGLPSPLDMVNGFDIKNERRKKEATTTRHQQARPNKCALLRSDSCLFFKGQLNILCGC